MIRPAIKKHQYADFLDRIDRLTAIYKRLGYSITGRVGDGRYEQHPVEIREMIIDKLDGDIALFGDLADRSSGKMITIDSLRTFCYRFKLIVPDNVLDKVESEAVVEIYDRKLMQRFRSPNFFNFTSHPLENLESRPYYELFKKRQDVEDLIGEKAVGILQGKNKDPDYVFAGVHRLWEINAPKNLVTTLESLVASPIYDSDDGSIAGIIHVCQVRKQIEFSVVRENFQAEAPIPPTCA